MMNKEKNKIKDSFQGMSFQDLSLEEQERVWRGVTLKRSPILSTLNYKNTMIPLMITLVLALGVGGTVVTADNARPGKALFKLDQKIEDFRLEISGEEKKNELRIKFAEERLEELDEISASHRSEVNTEGGWVENLSDEEKESVSTGLSLALGLISDVSHDMDDDSEAELEAITDELNDYLDDLPEDAKIKVRVDEDKERARIDVKTEDGHLKIDLKDGEVRVKTSEGKSDDDEDEEKDENDSEDSLEIEADVFTNQTIVKIEIEDKKTIFTTSADTQAEIIAAIKAKYPSLTSAQIEAALEMEIENRPSLSKDLLLGGDSNDDDNDEDEDEDEDSDEDEDEDSDDDE